MASVFSLSCLGLALVLLAPGEPLRALDAPSAFTIDLPFQANAATPAWLGHPETPATTFATLNLPIQPPDATASLLVTIVFQEKPGGFLRLMWNSSGQVAQLLSDNFYEGISMSNQRSLLVSPDTLASGGTLSLQCGDMTLGVQRIRLQWLEDQSGLVAPEIRDMLVSPAPGVTQPAMTLNGQPAPADPAVWKNQVVVVPITDTAQRIEQGVEYSVQIDNAPAAARLEFKENGLPLGKHLVLWVNQQRAGTITPEVPDLLDDGFLTGTDSSTSYVGWRHGSIFVPLSGLKVGTDTIQLSVEDDVAGVTGGVDASSANTAPPLAIRDLVMELSYPLSTPSYASSVPLPSTPAMTSADLSIPGATSAAHSSTTVP